MRALIIICAIWGLISVAMGALADHALAIPPEKINSIATAIDYHMTYSALAMSLALLKLAKSNLILLPSILLFLSGNILFSGSIYLSIIPLLSNITFLTPIGGVTMMLAWVSLIWFGIKQQKD